MKNLEYEDFNFFFNFIYLFHSRHYKKRINYNSDDRKYKSLKIKDIFLLISSPGFWQNIYEQNERLN